MEPNWSFLMRNVEGRCAVAGQCSLLLLLGQRFLVIVPLVLRSTE